MLADVFKGLTPLCGSLRAEKRPIYLYGTGDGAEKINAYLLSNGIAPEGVVASDGFVRGQSFSGFKVGRIADAAAKRGALCLVLCFGLEEEAEDVLAPLEAAGHRVVSPDLPLFGSEVRDGAFMLENAEKLERVYSLLADGLSKEIFVSLLKYSYTGDPCFLKIPRGGEKVESFYSRGGIHIDVGAYDGDTATEFARESGGNYTKLIAFEPDKATFKKLCANTANLPRVVPVNALCGEKCGKVAFSGGGGRASHAEEGAKELAECVTVDSFTGFTHTAAEGEPVGSIKIDAEGMDEAVICGAANTLWRCKSNVCCAVYHRAGDLFGIPLLLRCHDPKYKLYLRKKPCLPAWDVFVYAVREDL